MRLRKGQHVGWFIGKDMEGHDNVYFHILRADGTHLRYLTKTELVTYLLDNLK